MILRGEVVLAAEIPALHGLPRQRLLHRHVVGAARIDLGHVVFEGLAVVQRGLDGALVHMLHEAIRTVVLVVPGAGVFLGMHSHGFDHLGHHARAGALAVCVEQARGFGHLVGVAIARGAELDGVVHRISQDDHAAGLARREARDVRHLVGQRRSLTGARANGREQVLVERGLRASAGEIGDEAGQRGRVHLRAVRYRFAHAELIVGSRRDVDLGHARRATPVVSAR